MASIKLEPGMDDLLDHSPGSTHSNATLAPDRSPRRRLLTRTLSNPVDGRASTAQASPPRKVCKRLDGSDEQRDVFRTARSIGGAASGGLDQQHSARSFPRGTTSLDLQQALELSGSLAGLSMAPVDTEADDGFDRLLDRLDSGSPQSAATNSFENGQEIKMECREPASGGLVATLLATVAQGATPEAAREPGQTWQGVKEEPGPSQSAPTRQLCGERCAQLWRDTAGAALALRAQIRELLQVDTVPGSPSLHKIAPPVLTAAGHFQATIARMLHAPLATLMHRVAAFPEPCHDPLSLRSRRRHAAPLAHNLCEVTALDDAFSEVPESRVVMSTGYVNKPLTASAPDAPVVVALPRASALALLAASGAEPESALACDALALEGACSILEAAAPPHPGLAGPVSAAVATGDEASITYPWRLAQLFLAAHERCHAQDAGVDCDVKPPALPRSAAFDDALPEDEGAPPRSELFARVYEGHSEALLSLLTPPQWQLLRCLERDLVADVADGRSVLAALQGLGLPPLRDGAAVLSAKSGARAVDACALKLCTALMRAALLWQSSGGTQPASGPLRSVRRRRRPRTLGRLREAERGLAESAASSVKRLKDHAARLREAAASLQGMHASLVTIEIERAKCVTLGALCLRHIVLELAARLRGAGDSGELWLEAEELWRMLQRLTAARPRDLWRRIEAIVRSAARLLAGNQRATHQWHWTGCCRDGTGCTRAAHCDVSQFPSVLSVQWPCRVQIEGANAIDYGSTSAVTAALPRLRQWLQELRAMQARVRHMLSHLFRVLVRGVRLAERYNDLAAASLPLPSLDSF